MKTNKIVLALMVLSLCACNETSSNQISNESSLPESIISQEPSISQEPPSVPPSVTIPTESVSFVLPDPNKSTSTSQQPSQSTSTKPSLPPLSTSTSVEDTRIKIDESDFIYFLAAAYNNDQYYKSVSISRYSMSSSAYSSYTRRQYTMTAYSNDITIYSGSYRNVEINDYYEATFKEQRVYKDGEYSEIRKYPNTFRNYAYKQEVSEDVAQYNLNIGQSLLAYSVVNEFKQDYNMKYEGYLEDNGDKHVTYAYIDNYVDDNNYVMCALIEIRIDKDNYLKDFFYSEGYYDVWYADRDVATLRRHGVNPIKKGGYSYEMVNAVKGERKNYEGTLPFPLEDNFISEMSFANDEITISLSELGNDEKYIYLLDYLNTNPECGETSGCPVTNLSFSLVEGSESVAYVSAYNLFYLEILSVGEVTVTAYDAANSVSSSNTLKVIIVD